jgi:hypothetical protein
VLLSLEIVILGLFLILSFLILGSSLEIIIFYLVMVVCEASLGLSILVMSVFFYGVDYLRGISFLRC